MAAAQSRRGAAQERTLPELGQMLLGSAYRSAESKDGTAFYEVAPKQDGDPDQNYRRLYMTSSLVMATTFNLHPEIKKINFKVVDREDTSRRLAAFSITREASSKIDWSHGVPPEVVIKAVKTDYLDPAFKDAAARFAAPE